MPHQPPVYNIEQSKPPLRERVIGFVKENKVPLTLSVLGLSLMALGVTSIRNQEDSTESTESTEEPLQLVGPMSEEKFAKQWPTTPIFYNYAVNNATGQMVATNPITREEFEEAVSTYYNE